MCFLEKGPSNALKGPHVLCSLYNHISLALSLGGIPLLSHLSTFFSCAVDGRLDLWDPHRSAHPCRDENRARLAPSLSHTQSSQLLITTKAAGSGTLQE